MDFDEVVIMAQEQVITDLISGKNFRGLGTTAKLIVMAVATPANQNAIALMGEKTARTHELYNELVEDCQKQFVMDILGFGTTPIETGACAGGTVRPGPITPQEAAKRLVEKVYDQYYYWAKLARDASE
jgi:hypothetical protein